MIICGRSAAALGNRVGYGGRLRLHRDLLQSNQASCDVRRGFLPWGVSDAYLFIPSHRRRVRAVGRRLTILTKCGRNRGLSLISTGQMRAAGRGDPRGLIVVLDQAQPAGAQLFIIFRRAACRRSDISPANRFISE